MSASVVQNPSATVLQAVAAEFQALTSACGVYDITNRARLALTGKDRVRWLNGMISNNIRDLAVGRGVYAFLLTPQGKILGDLFAYSRGESIVLDTDRSQLDKILETLKRYIIMDKVEIADISDSMSVVGVAGSQASEVIGKVFAGAATSLEPLQFEELAPGRTMVRGDNPAVPSFEIWLDPADTAKWKAAMVAAGAMEVGAEAVALLRIATGVPRYGQDIHDRELPQETGQTRALSFTKGCYIGQEIVERIRARGNVHRMFAGFLVDGDLPAAGSKIQAGGKDVGEVTSVASLPLRTGEVKVALGYIRREAAANPLKADAASLKLAELPFREVFS